MRWPILCALAVVCGVVLAAVWAASPVCQGAFCLGSREVSVARGQEQEPAARAKVTADELERIWQEAAPAEQAPAVPLEFRTQRAEATPKVPDRDTGFLEQDDLFQTDEESIDPELAEFWDAAVFAAINEPDDQRREQAISEVGLLRNEQSVAVLLDVAFADPAADNRCIALETLWYSAADGLDADGTITTALREALKDPDPRVTELAEKALADLAKLAARRD